MRNLKMEHLTILTGIVSVIGPLLIFSVSQKPIKKAKPFLPLLYCFVIFCFTIFGRMPASERVINLTPLWSYAKFDQADIRWQVYMNIFLYIPFGFLLPYSSKRTFLQTFLIGLCLSLTTETLQYIFALGLCETDDVIHNTLGCIIGYWYWFAMEKLRERRHKE